MNTATPFPWTERASTETGETGFRSIFENAPLAAARCTRQGVIVEMNSAFEQSLDPGLAKKPSVHLYDLVPLEDRAAIESLLREVVEAQRESFRLERKKTEGGLGPKNWTIWRVAASGDALENGLLIAECNGDIVPTQDNWSKDDWLQSQRWEAVGRLAGGVVHDFNNILTGVMLYCDLLLSSIDGCDRRRRHVEEIRSAIMQATGMVQQLLVFARPQASQVRELCLNQIAQALQSLLTRLIGEHISLELKLDPELGLIKIDQAQLQQILLNLILNARDALPRGGRIVLETSNCSFQKLANGAPAGHGITAFPCVLLTVSDDGCGMDASTLQRLFEPFFTTKSAGKGTGLGLTTVRGIVTAHGGLIHVESQPGQGTGIMVVLPRVVPFSRTDFADLSISHPGKSLTLIPEIVSPEIKKESLP
jgi:two-component system cell cycle sensor histidine kinase/response regulator CckA